MLGQGLFPSSDLELCKMGRPGGSCRGKASKGEGVGMGSALGADVETRGQLRSWEKREFRWVGGAHQYSGCGHVDVIPA